MTAGFCRIRTGVGRCGGPLEASIGLHGVTRVHCARCERRQRGVCQECPARVQGTVGKAKWCQRCREREADAAHRRFRQRHREELRRRAREQRRDPIQQQRLAERERRYRAAHPEKAAAYAPRAKVLQRARYLANRQRIIAQVGRYQREHRTEVNAQRRARYAAKRQAAAC